MCIICEDFTSLIKPQKCYFGPYQLPFMGRAAFVVSVAPIKVRLRAILK